MRGASALQAILEVETDKGICVFVVWEPVLPTDQARPTSSVLARLSDRRASQYWDPKHVLSELFVTAALADPKRFPPAQKIGPRRIAWDVVSVYPRGVRWDPAGILPIPSYYGYPVVEVTDALREAIHNAGQAAAIDAATGKDR